MMFRAGFAESKQYCGTCTACGVLIAFVANEISGAGARYSAPSRRKRKPRSRLESSVCVLESPCGVVRGQMLRRLTQGKRKTVHRSHGEGVNYGVGTEVSSQDPGQQR
jgi:hypothetical protein